MGAGMLEARREAAVTIRCSHKNEAASGDSGYNRPVEVRDKCSHTTEHRAAKVAANNHLFAAARRADLVAEARGKAGMSTGRPHNNRGLNREIGPLVSFRRNQEAPPGLDL